ncbi:SflA family class IV lanthipeptide [Streptomyces sp. NPDC007172]|uniref:SflA family class IV lanthipeptide n=1 Tax=unclassified Streptomyces TaxID=2593676 RepID=UPI0036BC99E1
MSPLELQIREAEPLDMEEQLIEFEDDADAGRRIEACLADPWPTATTRVACD